MATKLSPNVLYYSGLGMRPENCRHLHSSTTTSMMIFTSSTHGFLTHFHPCSTSTNSTASKPNRDPELPTCTHTQGFILFCYLNAHLGLTNQTASICGLTGSANLIRWYLCLYVEINSQCNCSITHKIIQLLHCMWLSSNQLENFLCGSHT